MSQWKLNIDPQTNLPSRVNRILDNGDHQSMLVDSDEYRSWLAEGNEPLPADEPEGQTA
jgi:hypothetical protein